MLPPPMTPGTLVISLDFELHWGVRDKRSVDAYRTNLLGVRQVVPDLLAVFGEYGIHATWATVGFLFFEDRDALLQSLPAHKPRYRNARLDPYADLGTVGRSESDDPFHYAASLLRLIAAAEGQEIGTHTFSHFYCMEQGQDELTFREDLEAAVRAATRLGVTLESIVFPRNQVNRAYLAACRDAGLLAFRGTMQSGLYSARNADDETLPKRAARLLDAYLPFSGSNACRAARAAEADICEVPASRFLRPFSPRLAAIDPLRRMRVRLGMERAAREGALFHLWWHPHNFGRHRQQNLDFLRRVLDDYAALRERFGMRSKNMREVAGELRAEG
jgi:peptidoglycan/xylan/chitin deacetylase (PgdA/CDA1 family)